jgi:hypothetical protein
VYICSPGESSSAYPCSATAHAAQLLIEQRNYPHIGTYVFKAEAALEAAGSKNDQGSKSSIANREGVQTRLEFATALAHLGQSNYDKAAYGFLKLGPAKLLGDWVGKVRRCDCNCHCKYLIIVRQIVAPGDIAIYGTLCALASLSRSAIRASVLENATFGVYIEQEPYVREMIDAYMSSKFKTVLELLERYSVSAHRISFRIIADLIFSPRLATTSTSISSHTCRSSQPSFGIAHSCSISNPSSLSGSGGWVKRSEWTSMRSSGRSSA